MGEWYCKLDGKSVGPLTDDQLRELVAWGVIDLNTSVWQVGFPAYTPIRNCGAASVVAAHPPSASSQPQPVADQRPPPLPKVPPPRYSDSRENVTSVRRPSQQEQMSPEYRELRKINKRAATWRAWLTFYFMACLGFPLLTIVALLALAFAGVKPPEWMQRPGVEKWLMIGWVVLDLLVAYGAARAKYDEIMGDK